MLTRIIAMALLLTASAASFALDIKPYSAQALSAEQQAGKRQSRSLQVLHQLQG